MRDYRISVHRTWCRAGQTGPSLGRPADVEALRDDCAAGLSARTVVRHLTVAHGVFRHAVRAYGLARNPASAELVDRPTVRYCGEFVTFDAEELRRSSAPPPPTRTRRSTSPPR